MKSFEIKNAPELGEQKNAKNGRMKHWIWLTKTKFIIDKSGKSAENFPTHIWQAQCLKYPLQEAYFRIMTV